MTPEKISGNLSRQRHLLLSEPKRCRNSASQPIHKKGLVRGDRGRFGIRKKVRSGKLLWIGSAKQRTCVSRRLRTACLGSKGFEKQYSRRPTDFRLIGGTLFENIQGASHASLEEIVEAAKAACIWSEISDLPMKLHTLTSSQFSAFSGGQIQWIAIVRALVRKPRSPNHGRSDQAPSTTKLKTG